jgi:hypothetical protein
MTTVFSGAYRTIIPEPRRFRESLYREVCLLSQNLPEGWTPRPPIWGCCDKPPL